MAKVTMPQLGESVAEGTIGRWLKQPGDAVAKYEALVEVVTDKVNAEVPSPYAGILREILAPEGSTVPNNADIAVIETAEDAAAGASAVAAQAESSGAVSAAPEAAPAATSKAPAATSPAAATGGFPGGDLQRPGRPSPGRPGRRGPSPARRLARRRGTGPVREWRDSPGPGSDPRARARRRSERTHDPGGAAPAPGARPVPGRDRRHRGRRQGHPRGRPRLRRGPPVRRVPATDGAVPTTDGAATGGRAIGVTSVALAPAAALAPPPRPPPPDAPRRGLAAAASGPAAAAPAASAAPVAGPISFPPGVDEVLVPMTQMRKGIAAQMTRSLQCAARVHPDGDRRDAPRPRSASASRGPTSRRRASRCHTCRSSVKASADALKRNPTLNAHWTDRGLVAKRQINIGRRGRRRRGADRPGHPGRGPAVDPRAQRGDHGRRQPRPGEPAAGRRLRRRHVHGRQHRLPRHEPRDAHPQRRPRSGS